jgi:N-acetyl sugar amidotransferase
MKKCARCLLPETHETISFDSRGICSVCQNREFRDEKIDWNARRIALDVLVNKAKGTADYDCIIPFSGGKDSTYTLYFVVKELGLKPLVVSFDHGFYRPNMLANRNRVVETLGVDLLTFKPNWLLVRKLMLQSLLEKGDFCWHCHTGIFSYPMWIAIEKKVSLILWGETSSEYASYYSYEDDEKVDEDRFNQTINLGITADDMKIRMVDEFSQRDFKPYTYPPKKLLRELNVNSLALGSFIPWNPKEQAKLISEELGWSGDEVEGVPPEFNYEKIECYMQGVRDYIKYRKRGYSRVSHLMALELRKGTIDKDSAEKLISEFEGKRPASLDLFLNMLGLSEEDFEGIIKKHRVDPWDDKVMVQIGKKPHDYSYWQTKPVLTNQESQEIVQNFRYGSFHS